MERQMIRDYEGLIGELLEKLDAGNAAAAVELARLPLQVRGFGYVKLASAENVAAQRDELLATFRAGGAPVAHAAE
jgi:indolepyruvate ferredoxin oxidoreductase